MLTEIETIKASQLAELTEVTDSNYVVVTDGATSKKVKATKLKGNSLTTTQTQQLSAAYTHSQTTHVKFTDIPSLDGYATENFVTTKIAEAALNGSEVDLSGYATKDDLTSKVDKAEGKSLSTNDLTNELKSNYDKAYLHSQSTHVQPSNYYTKAEIDLSLSNKANISHAHTEYASIDHVHNYNDLTNKPTIPSKTSDLTNDSSFLTAIPDTYATKTYVDNAIANASTSEEVLLSTYQTKTDDELITQNKTIVGAINETFQSVSNGKTLIASAITDKGISTSNTDTFETMANNIASIITGSGSTEIKYVESIALDKNTATINLGETEQLTATLTPTDATIQDILWKSSNEAIATVNNGLISTLALGNVNITATSREGYLSAICSIVIVDPYSGSYVTDESGNRLMAEDRSYLITD